MRVALVDGERMLAAPGLKAICPACESPVIPHCGKVRVHHWAHRGERSCDRWWEPRTEWHIRWQDRFPLDWQEIIRFSSSGEKHIADVHTIYGLTLEFQYSNLQAEEIAAREAFYGNMVWVVSGARLQSDFPRFRKARQANLRGGDYDDVVLLSRPEEFFQRNWLTCTKPVFFDFEGAPRTTAETMPLTDPLWCLLPGRMFDRAAVLKIQREDLPRAARDGMDVVPTQTKQKLEHVLALTMKLRVKVRRCKDGGRFPRF